jgi:inorganic pyrophosphatase
MNLWHELEPGPHAPDIIHVVVEIPKGSRNKYEFHKSTGAFKLDRVLYSPVHYPGDYGFIPQSYYGDGDPLDVLVMTNLPTFTGCIVEARPIGMFRMLDKGEADDKVLIHSSRTTRTTPSCRSTTSRRSSTSLRCIRIWKVRGLSR